MMILAASAALIGFVHSLAPGHWLPVVLLAKARKWPMRTTLVGALVAGSGHVLISMIVGAVSLAIGAAFFEGREEEIERYGSVLLILFGLGYAVLSYFRHSTCHGHTHHGPKPDAKRAPFAFLFSLGLTPCIAVLPIFGAASTRGALDTAASMVAFGVGVFASLASSTWLVTHGMTKLDHPILEHYGDVITGLSIVAVGVVLFFVPL